MQGDDLSHVFGGIVTYYSERKHFKCQTCERLPCDRHEAREPTTTPHPELRLHAMIALYLYHGSSEVALDTATVDSWDRCDDVLCRV